MSPNDINFIRNLIRKELSNIFYILYRKKNTWINESNIINNKKYIRTKLFKELENYLISKIPEINK